MSFYNFLELHSLKLERKLIIKFEISKVKSIISLVKLQENQKVFEYATHQCTLLIRLLFK